jgi:ribonucleoside-diphosphate reductase beta chain
LDGPSLPRCSLGEGGCRRLEPFCALWRRLTRQTMTTQTVPTELSSDGRQAIYKFQDRTFRLDKEKARARYAAKRVINGLRTAELNVLPLKYPEAYRIYKKMKANHWEPEVIDLSKDCALWNSNRLNSRERWIIELGVGYFSAAEGIVGDSVLHVIEENLTAAELKHAALRQIAEESIHMDSLLHIISSLSLDLDEVTAKFQDIDSVRHKNDFITQQLPELKYGLDLTQTANKQKFAKALFGITQVMEGTQFYALFAMILSLHRQNKMTGIGQVFQYTLRDESNHIALGRYLLEKLIEENPDIWTEAFQAELVSFMREGVELEKEFVRDCLPGDSIGLTQKDFLDYVEYNADRRLAGVRLTTISSVQNNPFAWLDEVIFLPKEKNFFETRVTEYQTSGSLSNAREDDLI